MPREPVDIGALEIGLRYRVDWTHDALRRTFRLVGTLVALEEAAEDPTEKVLVFEVKPRFASPTLQRVHAATLKAIEPQP